MVLFATAQTEERQPLFHWVGPILRVQWLFLSRKWKGTKIKSLDDARRVGKIGTYISDVRDHYLSDLGFRNLERSSDLLTNYRKLAMGRLDLVATADLGLPWAIENIGFDPEAFEVAFVFKQMDDYIAFSRQTDPALVKQWRDAFQSMKDDGTFQRLYAQWLPGLKPPMN